MTSAHTHLFRTWPVFVIVSDMTFIVIAIRTFRQEACIGGILPSSHLTR